MVLIEHNMCVRVRQKYPKWYGFTALGLECLKSADVNCILNGTQRGFGEAPTERGQVRFFSCQEAACKRSSMVDTHRTVVLS